MQEQDGGKAQGQPSVPSHPVGRAYVHVPSVTRPKVRGEALVQHPPTPGPHTHQHHTVAIGMAIVGVWWQSIRRLLDLWGCVCVDVEIVIESWPKLAR